MFFPAYFEDNDFHHRFASRFPDRIESNLSALEPAVKRNSASAEREPTLLGNFSRNREYFVSKWGGLPGEEQRHPETPLTIASCFDTHCARASDINEHLPTLLHLAKKCPHVTELGVRSVISTWAFLLAAPTRLISYDIEWHPNVALAVKLADEAGIGFEFYEQDVLKVVLEATDLLFIDTLHTYRQLRHELRLHAAKVRQCIVMHDTVSYGFRDQIDEGEVIAKRGLITAIVDFLESPQGQVWEHYGTDIGNNGLTILVRRDGNFDPDLAQPVDS